MKGSMTPMSHACTPNRLSSIPYKFAVRQTVMYAQALPQPDLRQREHTLRSLSSTVPSAVAVPIRRAVPPPVPPKDVQTAVNCPMSFRPGMSLPVDRLSESHSRCTASTGTILHDPPIGESSRGEVNIRNPRLVSICLTFMSRLGRNGRPVKLEHFDRRSWRSVRETSCSCSMTRWYLSAGTASALIAPSTYSSMT